MNIKNNVISGYSYLLAHKKVTGAALVALVIIGGGVRIYQNKAVPNETNAPVLRAVTVSSVSALSNGALPFSVVGTVTSQSEATVRPEKSGQIVALYKKLGDRVSAGTIIAELDNKSERAAVLQAQASVDVAKANRAKVAGGSRDEQRAILEATLTNAKQSLETAKSATASTILSSFAAAEDAVGTTDALFSNPDTNPQLTLVSSNSQYKIDAQNLRVSLKQVLNREASVSATVNAQSNLELEITNAEADLRAVRAFLDVIVSALNTAIPVAPYTETSIAASLASVTAARSGIVASLSALNSARDSLNSKASAITVAEKNLQQGVTGGQKEDIDAADAVVKQAEAGLAAAYAQLEKGIIRAPITGTINSLTPKRGDFVQALTPVVVVANNGALEVVAYVTESDAQAFTVGTNVSIEGGAEGTITRVAPAIDPLSKKIEVRIGITKNTDLTNGEAVTLTIERGNAPQTSEARITIPITALKVGSNEMTIFTVEEGVLVAHPVTIGTLLGDRVVITQGVTGNMQIVTDARGLRAGQKVTIK